MSKFADVNEKIAESVTEGYKKIEDGVVGGYKKIEDGVVGGFKKIEDKVTGAFLNEDGSMKTGGVADKVVGGFNKIADKFVDTFLAKEGETVEEAKARVASNMEAQEAKNQAVVKESLEASRNIVEKNDL